MATMSTRREYPSAKDLTESLGGVWNLTRREGKAKCPAHDDTDPSLNITIGKGGKVLWVCRAGCAQDSVLSALRERGVWPEPQSKAERVKPSRIIATYDYTDEAGELRFQAVRYEPKEFRQRRPDGKGGWTWKQPTNPAHRYLPFRLPELIEAIAADRTVFVVEGEKDALSGAKLGITATCNAAGAGKWRREHAAYLKGADVVIIPDNDNSGRNHAEIVVDTLDGVANRIRILALPGLPDKGDLSDWIEAGGTADQLWALVDQAPAPENSTGRNDPTKPTIPTTRKPGVPEIRLVTGERARATDEAIAILRDRGDIFERSGELVRVAGDGIEPVTDEWLLDAFDRWVNFTAEDAKGNDYPKDAPPWLGKRINAKGGERGLQELRGVITAPTMREDGTLLDAPGYDQQTGLLLTPGEWPAVLVKPTPKEMKTAAAALWTPFAEFPFVDAAARGVHLATILTAVIRPTLPLAPGTSYDAPAAGTGKTLLAQCLQAICGMPREAIPECRDEEELRKRLLSALRAGKPVMLLDNIRGAFGSSSLEAMLTSATYTDRVLGASQMLSLPASALVLISGNNFTPSGDLWRRLLTCRIDAKTEAPERRSFDLEPFEHCVDNRQRMVVAALTLLSGFVASGSPRITTDRLASYEQWDDRVRQAVLWLGQQDILPVSISDPVDVIERAKRSEPERMKLAAVLRAVHALKADGRWRTADLIELTVNGNATLRDALTEVAGDRGAINSRMLGRWIERQAGRHCEGMWFQKAGIRSGNNLWHVKGKPDAERNDTEEE
jgi:Toprim domain-containing protein